MLFFSSLLTFPISAFAYAYDSAQLPAPLISGDGYAGSERLYV